MYVRRLIQGPIIVVGELAVTEEFLGPLLRGAQIIAQEGSGNTLGLALVCRLVCEKAFVSLLVACGERRSIRLGRPSASDNMGRNSVFGCESSQIQSISECAIGGVADVFIRA